MPDVDYRGMARDRLAKAKTEMAANDPHRLRYAALEIRQCMEAITYDRAQAYKDELPAAALAKWQPRKVLDYLAGIDPKSNMTSTVSIGREHQYGVSPPRDEMRVIGTDHVLSTQTLKEQYDAIGAYLHMQTMAQIAAGKSQDSKRLKERLDKIIPEIERVLSSTVFNVALGVFATLPTCARTGCGKPVSRRIPMGARTVEAHCAHCGALYDVTSDGKGGTSWAAKGVSVQCPMPGCTGVANFWPDEIKAGTRWQCNGCGKEFHMMLSFDEVAEHAATTQHSNSHNRDGRDSSSPSEY